MADYTYDYTYEPEPSAAVANTGKNDSSSWWGGAGDFLTKGVGLASWLVSALNGQSAQTSTRQQTAQAAANAQTTQTLLKYGLIAAAVGLGVWLLVKLLK